MLELAHDDDNEDNRIVALQFLAKLSHIFGTDLCEQFVSRELLSLGEDENLLVRKEAVQAIPIVGK